MDIPKGIGHDICTESGHGILIHVIAIGKGDTRWPYNESKI